MVSRACIPLFFGSHRILARGCTCFRNVVSLCVCSYGQLRHVEPRCKTSSRSAFEIIQCSTKDIILKRRNLARASERVGIVPSCILLREFDLLSRCKLKASRLSCRSRSQITCSSQTRLILRGFCWQERMKRRNLKYSSGTGLGPSSSSIGVASSFMYLHNSSCAIAAIRLHVNARLHRVLRRLEGTMSPSGS